MRANSRFERDTGPWFDSASLKALPTAARWFAFHRKCDPDIENCASYWIEIGRIRTAYAAIEWTIHLNEKNWHAHTDWDNLLRSRVLPQLTEDQAA